MVRRMNQPTPHPGWSASGLLFENCNCTVICPGHTHFSQNCTEERCIGFWALRVDEGRWGDVSLVGARAVVAYDSPQRMIDGGWREALYLEGDASPEQRQAMERILDGSAGGPWEVLARFVTERLPTRVASIRIDDLESLKRVAVDGLLEGEVEAIRGRDRGQPVTLRNMFNQIHAPDQVVARGSSRIEDGVLSTRNEGSHGLWSRFSWSVAASSGSAPAAAGRNA
jgi:hypothetical protein